MEAQEVLQVVDSLDRLGETLQKINNNLARISRQISSSLLGVNP